MVIDDEKGNTAKELFKIASIPFYNAMAFASVSVDLILKSSRLRREVDEEGSPPEIELYAGLSEAVVQEGVGFLCLPQLLTLTNATFPRPDHRAKRALHRPT